MLESLLDYSFVNPELLQRALTHSSSNGNNYEKLELLGDTIVNMLVTEMLFNLYPEASEGEIAKKRAGLICRDILAMIALELSLPNYIIAASNINRHNQNILADVVEALIAAIYLDGGIEEARKLVLRYWGKYSPRRDPKTVLQEWSQSHEGRPAPVYVLIARKGPDHSPLFTVEVTVAEGKKAQGSGKSRKAAEREAAANLLQELDISI